MTRGTRWVLAIAVTTVLAAGCSPERPSVSDTLAPGRECSAEGRVPRYDHDGLPSPVARQLDRLADAAVHCDYRALDRIGRQGGLIATFDGDRVRPADWADLEHDELPVMSALVDLFTLSPARGAAGLTWPSAVEWSRMEHGSRTEQEALQAVAAETGLVTWSPAGVYLGWQATIDEQGNWTRFSLGVPPTG